MFISDSCTTFVFQIQGMSLISLISAQFHLVANSFNIAVTNRLADNDVHVSLGLFAQAYHCFAWLKWLWFVTQAAASCV